jgi:hypothetical protein
MLFSQQSISDKQLNQQKRRRKFLTRMFMHIGENCEKYIQKIAIRSFLLLIRR